MDQRTAGHVDHEHARLCLGQYLLIQHVPITGIQRAGYDDEIRLPDALRPTRPLDALPAAIAFHSSFVISPLPFSRPHALLLPAAAFTPTPPPPPLPLPPLPRPFLPFPLPPSPSPPLFFF